MHADRLDQLGDLLVATGNVELVRGTARLLADRVEINRASGDAVATGHVIFYDGEDRFTASRIDYNVKTGTGVIYAADSRIPPYYRLSGERFALLGDKVYNVTHGVFTTCEAEPPPWSFHFGSGTADLERYATGRNASFWIKNIPLIPWLPFFGAAIRRERQSGFLFPVVGQSSNKGYFIEIPMFWAISDSQDLTVALDAMERKGIGGTADYRYVLSAENRGVARGFFLKETAIRDEDRGWGSIRHQWQITPDFSFKADMNRVTDKTVIREFGDTLHEISQQRVESNVFATRRWPGWNLVSNVFAYQDLTTTRPIALNRVPDVTLTGVRQPLPGPTGVLYNVDAEGVRFFRAVGSEGTRVDVHPLLSRPISPGGVVTITPFAGGRLTGYDRRVTGTRVVTGAVTIEDTEETARLRRLYEVGSDIEANLSRVYRPGGAGNFDAILHTIEPRATYTLIDGAGKDRLPRWTDTDAIRSSSRIEYSLTNRLRGRTVAPVDTEALRFEVVRLALSHSLDFKNNQQQLGNAVADLIVQPTPYLRYRGNLTHDVHGRGLQTAENDISVSLARLIASAGTRYNDPAKTNFFQGSLAAELTSKVAGRAIMNWDLRSGAFVESRLGVDIRFQCWALSIDYIHRDAIGSARPVNDVRFTVNLLGSGKAISNSFGLGTLGPTGGGSR